jgi:2-C-methyl-D-erythritol 4-phosphate cytidylyltransferase
MKSKTVGIVLAAGNGVRFGLLKQFIPIAGYPTFIHTLRNMSHCCSEIVLTVPEGFRYIVQTIMSNCDISSVHVIYGGITRQESILNALSYIEHKKYQYVVITDANRPLITSETINKCLSFLDRYVASVAISKTSNTICNSKDGLVYYVLDRNLTYEMLMPQCFVFDYLIKAHRSTDKVNVTDDTQLLSSETEIKAVEIPFWEGLKLTTTDDYQPMEFLLKERNER